MDKLRKATGNHWAHGSRSYFLRTAASPIPIHLGRRSRKWEVDMVKGMSPWVGALTPKTQNHPRVLELLFKMPKDMQVALQLKINRKGGVLCNRNPSSWTLCFHSDDCPLRSQDQSPSGKGKRWLSGKWDLELRLVRQGASNLPTSSLHQQMPTLPCNAKLSAVR